MSIISNNTILTAAEKKIESGLTPENRANYMKVVVSGMRVAMKDGEKSIIAGLKASKDPLKDCAHGAINLCLILQKQARNTIPVIALVPAAMTLMLNALSVADRLGIVKIDNAALVKATHYFTNFMFHILNISPKMLQHVASRLDRITSDPASMEAIHRKAGTLRDPRSSTPTAPGV